MARIITHNNTRYRHDPTMEEQRIYSGQPFMPSWPHIQEVRFGRSDDLNPDYGVPLECLPEIEDWPGHRPEQYLARGRSTPVEPGDLMAWVDDDDGSATLYRAPNRFSNQQLGNWAPRGTRAYLISRANPEHDAEAQQ